jgi:oxygen-independent coproporphyrinogen-3 oxidase
LLDSLTLKAVNKLADSVASSVSFVRADGASVPALGGVGRTALNIRVPFCAARCPFCAFPGELYTNSYAKIFIQGLKDEMRLYSEMIGSDKAVVERVYLSGGTPTLLYKELGTVAENVQEHFSFSGKVAMEASPTDLKEEVLRGLVDLGVKDLSVGIQSFNEGLLSRVLGRQGKRDDLLAVLRRVMDFGFDYVNIDLMFSLPGQTPSMLKEDLETATSTGVDGISTYPLMMMSYTNLSRTCIRANGAKAEGEGAVEKKSLQDEVDQYLTIVRHMRDHSYKLRTLWSFSTIPGAYEGPYEHDSFLGLGPRAWGMVNKCFTINSPSTEDYIATLREGKLPLFAYSVVRDFPAARLARRFYYGRIARGELEELYREDSKMKMLVGLLRSMRLLEWEGDWLKLSEKALGYGTVATKKIAMSTLSKMDEILRAG